jgi:hypothetical protein
VRKLKRPKKQPLGVLWMWKIDTDNMHALILNRVVRSTYGGISDNTDHGGQRTRALVAPLSGFSVLLGNLLYQPYCVPFSFPSVNCGHFQLVTRNKV